MTRTIYYTAMTLDGFVADPGDSLDWLLRQDHDAAGPFGFDAFLPTVGAAVMGSTTYGWILGHEDGAWPYTYPTWVLSSRELPKVDGDVRFARGDVRPVHEQLVAAADDRDVWVIGGGDLAGQFADAGLLDEVVASITPVTLGAGAPVLPRRLDLRLEETARNRAFVCARYTVLGTLTEDRT
ncbi:dihydrofolate reductase [Nitriliruptoraceae bacterium ZYF776]|nr:dihydrofolate reductase [Profundirhabdus halotolerans]